MIYKTKENTFKSYFTRDPFILFLQKQGNRELFILGIPQELFGRSGTQLITDKHISWHVQWIWVSGMTKHLWLAET